jgi:hypothetical protein
LALPAASSRTTWTTGRNAPARVAASFFEHADGART